MNRKIIKIGIVASFLLWRNGWSPLLAEGGVRLFYKFQEGESRRYKITVGVKVSSPAREETEKFLQDFKILFTQKVIKVDSNGSSLVKVSWEEFNLDTLFIKEGGIPFALKDGAFLVRIWPQGEMGGVEEELEFIQILQGLFPILKKGVVEKGEKWSQEISPKIKVSSGPTPVVRGKYRYQLVGFGSRAGHNCAEIKISLKLNTRPVPISWNGTRLKDSELSFSGEGVSYFDYTRGLVFSSTFYLKMSEKKEGTIPAESGLFLNLDLME